MLRRVGQKRTTLVDDIWGRTRKGYRVMPNVIFVMGTDGTVLYRSI
ncbi:hypothetical protein [Roseicitreum antarcticum]|nr:hypothetical protein [Roseicitreum antarcticum]